MFNFIGFCFSFIMSMLVFFVAGFTIGFVASLSVVAAIALACWCYRPLATKKPSQCVQMVSFGGYLFRVEVA